MSLAPVNTSTIPRAWAMVATSAPDEVDVAATLTGSLPPDLHGTLLRNGPGLFERAGVRKASLLDGDGMIHAFSISPDGVRYRNRFVRTAKFLADEAAGAYTTSSWTTRRPGGVRANLGGGPRLDDASVTVYTVAGQTWAIGPLGRPWQIDPVTLETRGLAALRDTPDKVDVEPHAKHHGSSGEWTLFRRRVGPRTTLSAVSYDRAGREIARTSFVSPRPNFMHDFIATERWVGWLMHPMFINLGRFTAGLGSFVEGLDWRPKEGTLLVLRPRNGEGAEVRLELPPRFMFHAVNAYDDARGDIVVDLVGYDSPAMFVGPDPVLSSVMRGRNGDHGPSGRVFRYRVDPRRRTWTEDLLHDGNHEFPTVAESVSAARHTVAYVASARPGCAFHHRVARLDLETSGEDVFDFGPDCVVSEPIFVPRRHSRGSEQDGYLLALVALGAEGITALAVLRADAVSDGPVCMARLDRHVPVTFHGSWRDAAEADA